MLLCPLAWLPAYSHWSEPEGRLPRNTDHLAQTESFELSLASFPLLPVSSTAALFPLLKLTTKTSSGSSLMWDPLLIFFPMFLYLIVALLSYSASTIFTHQKTTKQGSFHVGTPANMLITWGLAVVMLAQQRQDISETPLRFTSGLTSIVVSSVLSFLAIHLQYIYQWALGCH